MVFPQTVGMPADQRSKLADSAIMALAVTLPTIDPGLFGPIAGLVPLPVFFFLIRHGKKTGSATVRNGVLIALILCALAGTLSQVLFVLTTLPLGFALAYGAGKRLEPVAAGQIGIATLTITWLVFWSVIGMMHGANPYIELRQTIDVGLAEVAAYYQESKNLSGDMKLEIGSAIREMRDLVPRILPALMASVLLYTVWVNQVLGNWLINRFYPERTPWPPFIEWRLPEKLVWAGIAGGLGFLYLSGQGQDISLNILLVCAALYAFQGLAVTSSLLLRWSIVRPLRIAIYMLILLQRYGIIFLAIVGVADIWVDFKNRQFTLGSSDPDQQDR